MSENSATPAPAPSSPGPAAPAKTGVSMGKKVMRAVLVVMVLLVVGLVLLWLNLNNFVKAGIIRGGTYATDQETGLNMADLSISQGTLALETLDIGNPKGFEAKKLLTMKSCAVQVETSSIFTDTVYVPDISIQGLDVTLEQNGGKNNISEIIDIVQRKTAAATKNAAGEGKSSPGKSLKIGKLSMTGTKVHVRGNVGVPISLDLELPPMSIEDPTNPDGRPLKIADLVGKILLVISKQVMENPQLPENIREGMKNVQVIVNNLRGELDRDVKVFKQDSQRFEDAAKKGDLKGMQDAGKNMQEAGRNLQNMLNQNKQPAK